MNWVVRVANDAQRFIDGLPDKVRRQVSRSIGQLAAAVREDVPRELIVTIGRKQAGFTTSTNDTSLPATVTP